MEAIRKIATVKNGMISFKGLNKFNSQEVEVIILPLFNDSLKKIKFQKKNLLKYDGILESNFRNTSTKVDELIYGK